MIIRFELVFWCERLLRNGGSWVYGHQTATMNGGPDFFLRCRYLRFRCLLKPRGIAGIHDTWYRLPRNFDNILGVSTRERSTQLTKAKRSTVNATIASILSCNAAVSYRDTSTKHNVFITHARHYVLQLRPTAAQLYPRPHRLPVLVIVVPQVTNIECLNVVGILGNE